MQILLLLRGWYEEINLHSRFLINRKFNLNRSPLNFSAWTKKT